VNVKLVAFFNPIEVGWNATDATQEPPGGKVAGRAAQPVTKVGVVHCVVLLPDLPTALIVRSAPLALVLVMVAVWAVPVVPTSWLPNAPVPGAFHATE
jgi:hypothetical protein